MNIVRTNSDYKIQATQGGTITLDTGANIGRVVVTGNLEVQGNTTVIDTTNLQIEDNLILLNRGETGFGISETISGIEIARGTATFGNALFIFDESKNWNDPVTQTLRGGLFVFRTASGGINGIQTNSINTAGGDLNLINQGSGIISVSGTLDYETQVLDYNNALTAIDDDIIPNIRAVADKITYEINNSPSDKVRRSNTQVVVYDNNISELITTVDTQGSSSTLVRINHNPITNTEVNVYSGMTVTISGSNIANLNGTWPVITANELTDWFTISIGSAIVAANTVFTTGTVLVNQSNSNIRLIVDGAIYGEIQSNHADFYNIRLQDSTISGTVSNNDLILSAPGSGSVQIQDTLKIANVTSDPSAENGSVKIYTKSEGAGDTGIYFVNTNYRDELISKKKAIAFSILM